MQWLVIQKADMELMSLDRKIGFDEFIYYFWINLIIKFAFQTELLEMQWMNLILQVLEFLLITMEWLLKQSLFFLTLGEFSYVNLVSKQKS